MKFMKLLMLVSIVCSSAFATEAKLISITLEENKELIPAKDIKAISLNSYKELDRVELINGSIFYDTEVKEMTFKLPESKKSLSPVGLRTQKTIKMLGRFVVGGDGSGGG